MTIERAKLPFFTIALLILATTLPPEPASGRIDKDPVRQVFEEFNAEPRTTRPGLPLLMLNCIELDEVSYVYRLSGRFVTVATEGQAFRLYKDVFKKDHVRLYFRSDHGANSTIYVFSTEEVDQEFADEVVPAVLSDLFVFRDPPQSQRFVGNIASTKIHLRSANHLPRDDLRLPLATRAEGLEQGFTVCTICFPVEAILPMYRYAEVRRDALEEARMLELAYPVVADTTMQRHVTAIGERVLESFPRQLMGYDYSFKVLESWFPYAFTLPTGIVYLTSGLYGAIEDDIELAFVLAHEIAHVELNLFFRPRSYEPVTLELLKAYFSIMRRQEREADYLAMFSLAPFGSRDRVTESVYRLLLKLQFAASEAPDHEPAWYDTHPSFADRMEAFSENTFIFLPEGPCRSAHNSKGVQLLSIKVLALARDDEGATNLVAFLQFSHIADDEFSYAPSYKMNGRTRPVGTVTDADGTQYELMLPDPLTIYAGGAELVWIQIGRRNTEELYEVLVQSPVADFEITAFDVDAEWRPCAPGAQAMR